MSADCDAMHIFVYASVGFLIACIFGRRQWFYIRPDDSGRVAGSDVQTTLFCALKSRARLPIGKPIASQPPFPLAIWLHSRS